MIKETPRGEDDREQLYYRADTVEIPSDKELVGPTAETIKQHIQEAGWAEDEAHQMFLAVTEAIANAVKHGNKEDMEKHVRIVSKIGQHEVEVSVQDEGDGFDPDVVPKPTDEDRLLEDHGRGLLFMDQFCDKVEYNKGEKRITLTKYRKQPKHHGKSKLEDHLL